MERASVTRLRRDTQETRDRLLDAVGELLGEQGPVFALPELARRSGVATATVYRHFSTVHDAFEQFYYRLIDELVEHLATVPMRSSARRNFDVASRRWVEVVAGWGQAATRIRSHEGFLERVRREDPPTSALFTALRPFVEGLVEAGDMPRVDVEYAVLVWVTLFDERVIVDLSARKAWTSNRIANQLGASVVAALAAPRVLR